MDISEGRRKIQCQLMVEILTIFFLDLAWCLAPDGSLFVSLLFFLTQVDWKRDEIRVFFDYLTETTLLRKIFCIFLEFDLNHCATLNLLSRFDRIGIVS